MIGATCLSSRLRSEMRQARNDTDNDAKRRSRYRNQRSCERMYRVCLSMSVTKQRVVRCEGRGESKKMTGSDDVPGLNAPL